ncbi:MAG: hypothetical protein GX594_04485 [Pirellulaceae bacterium]|nr:hypothetical protein [Pirellulaceae bacterium]
MLILPDNWQEYPWGEIARQLYGGVHHQPKAVAFGECLTWAALDLTGITCFGYDRFEKMVKSLSRSMWQINDTVFAYLPILNDSTIDILEELTKHMPALVAIVPPHHRESFSQLCRVVMGNNIPSIWSIDDYLSYRMAITPHVLDLPTNRVFFELLSRYNTHVASTRFGRSLKINIPSDIS